MNDPEKSLICFNLSTLNTTVSSKELAERSWKTLIERLKDNGHECCIFSSGCIGPHARTALQKQEIKVDKMFEHSRVLQPHFYQNLASATQHAIDKTYVVGIDDLSLDAALAGGAKVESHKSVEQTQNWLHSYGLI